MEIQQGFSQDLQALQVHGADAGLLWSEQQARWTGFDSSTGFRLAAGWRSRRSSAEVSRPCTPCTTMQADSSLLSSDLKAKGVCLDAQNC